MTCSRSWLGCCFVAASIAGCQAAGMTAHNVAAHRALQHFVGKLDGFENVVRNNWAAVSAGAPFPDYLYTCGRYHGAGEEAHWTPWQEAAVNYVRSKYSWQQILTDQRASRLVAFLAGAVSHYITDLNWHGLGQVPSAQGFIEQLGISNFNCSGELCGVAHTTADTGGEFVAASELNLQWLDQAEWYVPVEDLVEIYAYANKTLNASEACYESPICFPLVEPLWIRECSAAFVAEVWAMKHFGHLIFPVWEMAQTKKAGAPHLAEAFLTWPVGGMDDNAMWTASMWNRFASWLHDGPPPGPYPNQAVKKPLGRKKGVSIGDHEAVHLVQAMIPVVKDLMGNSSFPMQPKLDDRLGGVHFKEQSSKNFSAVLRLGTTLARAALGLHEVDNLPSNLDVALRQRAEELAGVKPDSSQIVRAPTKSATSQTLVGDTPLEYFGTSSVLADVHPSGGDGCADLAVGSPGFGLPGDFQVGRVQIFAGTCATQRGETTRASFAESFTLVREIRGASGRNSRFGTAIAAGDLDGDGRDDLAIGAPTYQSLNVPMAVGNYTGSVTLVLSSGRVLNITSLVAWANFGAAIAVGDVNGDGKADLIVGAPLAGDTSGSTNSAGAVFIFQGPLIQKQMSTATATWVLKGTPFSWFGHRVSIEGGLLLISAPAERMPGESGAVGKLFAYGARESKFGVLLWSVTGDAWMSKAGFAAAVQSNTSNPMLAISAPSATLECLFGTQAGEVVILPLDSMKGNLTWSALQKLNGAAILKGKHNRGRFGWNLAFAEDDAGSGTLLVAAPMASGENGEVFAWRVGQGSGSLHSVACGTKSARFGAGGLLAIGRGRVAIAAPREAGPSGSNMPGALHVYPLPAARDAASHDSKLFV